MKKLLFVIPSLSSGGGERSLVNLLSQIDYREYLVDLFLFSHEGLFMEYVPKQVRILPIPDSYRAFASPIWRSVPLLLARAKPALAYSRVMFSLRNRTRSSSLREQYNWKYMSGAFERLEGSYDAAIGFLEKTSTYFCVEKVNAGKKLGWVHIDYDKLGMDPGFDAGYFDRLDAIVTVSEECAAILERRFPEQRHKVSVMHNIVSPGVIFDMAGEDGAENVYRRGGNEIVILSIGRLHEQKGFELAVEACRKLVDQGYNVSWNVIGEGEERDRLTRLIKSHKLERHFHLLGLKANPYPYIKQADLYVQTSRFEGKSIAIDEAKILKKPIVVTRFSTAKDQIDDGMDGLIVDMNADAVMNGIVKLLKDNGLRSRMTEHLSGQRLGTEHEIDKLYKLLV